MENYEENILIEIFKDEDLDVFGMYRKRRLLAMQSKNKIKEKLQQEKLRKHNIRYYSILSKKLIDIYGKEGAIPYLKKLFKTTALHNHNFLHNGCTRLALHVNPNPIQ